MARKMSRRRVLQGCGLIVPLAVVGQVLVRSRPAHAQQKATKQQVQYQETPKKGQDCEKCLHFVPPDGCKMVGGKINPKGWCLLFAPKPK
jgi:hypothetical protein